MNKTQTKKILIIFIFALVMILFPKCVNAAYINISTSKKTVNPGEKVTITISSDCIGRVNLSATNGTLSSDRVWIEGGAQSVNLTAGNSGNISVSATAEKGKMSNNGVDVTVSGASTSISIATQNSGSSSTGNNNSSSGSTSNTNNSGTTTTEKKSSNANLSNLGIKPNDFSGFKPSVTSYNVTVPNDVETVNVYANKQDSKAKISGTGNKNLKEGKNTITVTVTAEDGTKKNYTINITRQAKEETTEDEEETTEDEENTTETENQTDENTITENEEEQTEEVNGIVLKSLSIQDQTLIPPFNPEVFEYTINLNSNLEKFDIETLTENENYNVEISGNENFIEGENLITILVTDPETSQTTTYQITVNKKLPETLINEENKIYFIIGGVVLGIIVISIIIYVVKRNKSDEAEDYSNIYVSSNNRDYEDNIIDNESENISEDVNQNNESIKDKNFNNINNSYEDDYQEGYTYKRSKKKGKRFK